jgi:hypothetical protein
MLKYWFEVYIGLVLLHSISRGYWHTLVIHLLGGLDLITWQLGWFPKLSEVLGGGIEGGYKALMPPGGYAWNCLFGTVGQTVTWFLLKKIPYSSLAHKAGFNPGSAALVARDTTTELPRN